MSHSKDTSSLAKYSTKLLYYAASAVFLLQPYIKYLYRQVNKNNTSDVILPVLI